MLEQKTVVLGHGFASLESGKYDVDKLEPYLKAAGINVIHHDYGFKGAYWVYKNNPKEGKKLAALAPPGSTVIGHSNYGSVCQIGSLEPNARFTQAILISPAMGWRAPFGPSLRRVIVLYSPLDFPVIGSGLIPGHPWGWAGAFGYKRNDGRVESYNKFTDFGKASWGHLDIWLNKEALEFYARLIIDWVMGEPVRTIKNAPGLYA